ncbi:uncharacterized protein [Fopius arisanus]|nr:PREDICTED: uncharacterized protein LOC105265659 isoform X2 [Fopius arisanus]
MARVDNISEFEGLKSGEENSGFSRGDENSGLAARIQDLCPADRRSIGRLVTKLAECLQAKDGLEIDLAEARAENEALINRYEIFYNQQLEEKEKIRSQLAEKTERLDKFTLRTANAFRLLGDQMKIQEKEYLKLTDMVKELLHTKLRLENAVVDRDRKIRLIETKNQ